MLDFTKIKKSEREKATRLAKSAAGAALESDVQIEAREAATKTLTFVPGAGKSAKESFTTNFTPEQKAQIREMVANAKSPSEIEEIENSVKRGEFPSFALPSLVDESSRKRNVESQGETLDPATKKARSSDA